MYQFHPSVYGHFTIVSMSLAHWNYGEMPINAWVELVHDQNPYIFGVSNSIFKTSSTGTPSLLRFSYKAEFHLTCFFYHPNHVIFLSKRFFHVQFIFIKVFEHIYWMLKLLPGPNALVWNRTGSGPGVDITVFIYEFSFICQKVKNIKIWGWGLPTMNLLRHRNTACISRGHVSNSLAT